MDLNEQQLRTIVREETRQALKEVGLADDDAGNDVRDLRSLITDWRSLKKTIWHTVARWGTLIVLGLITLGAWNRINGGGSE
jgi:hypothetical protein